MGSCLQMREEWSRRPTDELQHLHDVDVLVCCGETRAEPKGKTLTCPHELWILTVKE